MLLTPYKVQKQTLEVQVPKANSKIIGLTKHAETKVHDNKISYGGVQKDIAPLSFDQITIMFENPAPYMVMTEATRKISVSHWGNIAVDEHFRIENIGPKVKNEFSRYDFDMGGAGQNCLKKLNSEYPYYIKGMYVGDFIGNISSTHALRTSTNVELEFEPRFPVCGGWQVDWNQGYSMPTRFHLSESTTQADLFKLTMPFLHQYD